MAYVLKPPGESDAIGLPRKVVRHLNGASESDLKVIVYLYSEFPDGFESENIPDIAAALGITQEDVTFAVAYWRGAGIIKSAKALKKKEPTAVQNPEETQKVPLSKGSRPLYPAEQVAQAIETVPNMKSLVDFCQRRFGKIFNPSQLSTLYSFYDNLGFDAESIMLVAEHCGITEKKSLGYMEKILITLSDNNITQYSEIEKYLSAKLRYNEEEKKLRKLCGFTSRELSPSEKKIIGVWFNEWELDFSLIEKAYEMTVDRISKPSLKYMNTILSDWHDREITGTDEIENRGYLIEKSHDAEEFFKAAVAKSMSTQIE